MSTPEEFAAQTHRLATDIAEVPREGMVPSSQLLAVALRASGAARGKPKVRPGEITVTPPTTGAASSTSLVRGHGFATLAEAGSYKKPSGYDIEPRNAPILGNPALNFAAAYAHHPPIPPRPFVDSAVTSTEEKIGEIYDGLVVRKIAAVF